MSEQQIAEQVIAVVRELAGPDAQAEAYVERCAQALTRFANSYIHQNVLDDVATVRLRVHLDGRTANGSSSVISGDGIRALVRRTIDAARLCPVDPAWPGLAGPAALAGAGSFDEATAGAEPAERAAQVRAFVDAAGGLETAGFCRSVLRSVAFANSAGQSVAAQVTDAAMDGIARSSGADGVARSSSVRLAEIDGAALGARAAAKARAATTPVDLAPGRYEVVLEPGAVADIVQNLSYYGFNGKMHAEGQSFAELGTAQFDPSITLVDDAVSAGAPGLPFDGEGTPRQRRDLVTAGRTSAVAHDRRSAAQAGATSTGHASLGGTFGPIPGSVRLEPAPAAVPGGGADQAVDPVAAGLLAGVERGLLVTDFWYTRVLDPKSLVITGLTRNGVWLIEDGKLAAPVRNVRFTQCYPQALGPGAVLGVGDQTVTIPSHWGAAWWTVPALHLASWNVTGGAAG